MSPVKLNSYFFNTSMSCLLLTTATHLYFGMLFSAQVVAFLHNGTGRGDVFSESRSSICGEI